MRCGSTWLYQGLEVPSGYKIERLQRNVLLFFPEMLQHDFEGYEAHFEPGNGGEPKPVRGEISPEYVRLKAWQVNPIANLLPDLRIILTLRHPIERVWSQAVLELGYLDHRDIRKIHSVAFLQQVERARSMLSSDYRRTIEIWSHAFGREALHIDFFDRLCDDSRDFHQRRSTAYRGHDLVGSPGKIHEDKDACNQQSR
jgi:hypothetical protein